MKPALDGVKVVGFELAVAGPFCTHLLADMGADVIKIEKPGTGDSVRGWDSAVRGLSSGYVWLNRNKRDLTLNVKHKNGLKIMRHLVQDADIFVENFAPGVAERSGLGYEALKRINPRLIYASISGYGQGGPYGDRKAFDLMIQGESGLIATTGSPKEPAKVGPPIVDLATGINAALGIMFALYQRERTGHGQLVDVAMFDAMLSWLGYFPQHFWHKGEEPLRVGLRHHYMVPYGPFLARDGKYVNLAVVSSQDWEAFCLRVIERPDLYADERYKNTESRLEHREELERTVEEAILDLDSQAWLERLASAALPFGEVRGVAEALAHPQVAFRKLIQDIDSPVGKIPTIASPINLSESPSRYGPLPALGQHTDSILTELGHSAQQIKNLRAKGVV